MKQRTFTMKLLLASATFVAAAAIPGSALATSAQWPPDINLPAKVTAAASKIAGEPVVISCLGNLGEDGEDAYQYIAINIPVCQSLLRFLRGGRDGAAVASVLTLTHEAEHASGIKNETVAECHAYRDVDRVVRMLGAHVTRDMQMALDFAHNMVPSIAYYKHPCKGMTGPKR